MALRRRCRLSNTDNRHIDLCNYGEIIIDVLNMTVPGKNPTVTKDYFETDILSRGESIRVGQALSRVPELAAFGKTVTTFRLFDGEIVKDDEKANNKSNKAKGGRK